MTEKMPSYFLENLTLHMCHQGNCRELCGIALYLQKQKSLKILSKKIKDRTNFYLSGLWEIHLFVVILRRAKVGKLDAFVLFVCPFDAPLGAED